MYGSFRQDNAADSTIFFDAAVRILVDYSDDVIERVTDPARGIPSRQKWPPQPSEVREACEAIEQPRREALARAKREAEQIAERERIAALKLANPNSEKPKGPFYTYADVVRMKVRPIGRFEKREPAHGIDK